MKVEIVKQRVLTADVGSYLYNGEVFAKTVVLPLEADPAVWLEVTEEVREAVENGQNGK